MSKSILNFVLLFSVLKSIRSILAIFVGGAGLGLNSQVSTRCMIINTFDSIDNLNPYGRENIISYFITVRISIWDSHTI